MGRHKKTIAKESAKEIEPPIESAVANQSNPPPPQDWKHGDLTSAYVRWMFETDEAKARAHYANYMHLPEVKETMEEMGLE